jgi:putative PIN family toxin of toxin-antitoxin system
VGASGDVSGVCRDPTDDKFLDAAISGLTAVLVTGDKDLLTIGEY